MYNLEKNPVFNILHLVQENYKWNPFLTSIIYLVNSVEFPLDVEEDTLMSIAVATKHSVLPDDCSTTRRRQSVLGQPKILFRVKVSSAC